MRLHDFLETQADIWENVWEAKGRPLEDLNITLSDDELAACLGPSVQELRGAARSASQAVRSGRALRSP